MHHQRLRHRERDTLRLPRQPAPLHDRPHVILIDPARRLQRPDGALAVMDARERGIEAAAVDAHLALALDEVDVRGAGLAAAVAEGAARGVDALRPPHHRERVHVPPVVGRRRHHLRRHQRRVDAVQPLQDLDDLVVLGGLHGLADHDAVLGQRAPGDARGLGWEERREGLVFAEELLEREQAVGEVRLAGEVGGGGRHDAGEVARGGVWLVGVGVVEVELGFGGEVRAGGGGEGVVLL